MRAVVLVLILGSCGFVEAQEPPAERADAPDGDFPLARIKPKPVPPRDAAALEASIERGIAFLLEDQNPDGSWGTAERTKGLNIYAPVPGAHHAFRNAVTALSLMALVETGSEKPEVKSAIERGERWLLEHLPQLRRATPDAIYNVWGHGYGIQALVRIHNRHPDDSALRDKVRQAIEGQFDLLRRYESVDGGWGYYDFRAGTKRPASSSTSFMNATVLIALHEAKEIGVEPPEDLVKRAVAATLRQMKPDSTFLYGEYLFWRPMHPVNQPGGSLGRNQACNAALRLWGVDRISDDLIAGWLDRLFARNYWLDRGRKRPIPHESFFAVAGYFYYYGHYYAGLCIELLPSNQRAGHQDQLAHRILALQEKDGSWWDYPFYNYHQQYGTAFALLTLVRCRSAEN